MKKLILIALFVPCFSFAQRFEISEQAGYSTTTGFTFFGDAARRMYGITNQVSAGYCFLRHFSVSAFYQFNNWDNHNNAYGISPDFVTKHLYTGLDLQMTTFSTLTGPNANFNTSWGYGLHIGSKQKIFKGLSCVEQLGFDVDNETLNARYNPFGVSREYLSVNETSNIWYLRAGLSYRI